MGNIKFFSLDQNFDNVTCCIPSFDFRAPSAQACIVSALSSGKHFSTLLGNDGVSYTRSSMLPFCYVLSINFGGQSDFHGCDRSFRSKGPRIHCIYFLWGRLSGWSPPSSKKSKLVLSNSYRT